MRTAIILTAILTLAVAAFAMLAPVMAHSWYSQACCNERDCSPIHEVRVKLTQQGYLIDGNFVIGHLDYRIRETPLGAMEPYHICKRSVKRPVSDRNTRCFYVPQGGS